MHARRLVLSWTVLLVSTSLAHAGITACGQSVAARATEVLEADLSCAPGTPAVYIEDAGVLQLNGHVIDGGGGVRCTDQRCRVSGPGEIRNGSAEGIRQLSERSRMRVEDVDIHDNAGNGILQGNPGRLTLRNVTLTGNLNGIRADFSRAVGESIVCNANRGNGMVVGRYTFQDFTLQGNGLLATGAPGFLSTARGRFRRATITGNGLPNGVDIATPARPGFFDSLCDRSGVWPSGGAVPDDNSPDWDICQDD